VLIVMDNVSLKISTADSVCGVVTCDNVSVVVGVCRMVVTMGINRGVGYATCFLFGMIFTARQLC